MADYYGTLAAARCLGDHGVPVTMAEWRLLAPARWSRHVSRTVRCPPVSEPERFIAWLMEFGAREPGHVLYPSSDDLAFLYAAHREELSRHFQLYVPPLSTILRLLDKKTLHAACAEVGLETPETHFPESDAELERLSRALPMPVLIKPRTQALFHTLQKGGLVADRAELKPRFDAFVRANGYRELILRHAPEVRRPMLQAYHPEAAEHIESVAGFIDETGELFATRGAIKVLQRPRKLGIGLCFEETPIEPAIVEKLRALCLRVGYHGAFEAELIRKGDRRLLIDFNPRFYSQMAFEVARGLPLPLLIHRAATGRRAELRALVQESRAWQPADRIYAHRFALKVLLGAQQLSGALSSGEADRWRRWYHERRAHAVDAAADPQDPIPGLLDTASHLWRYLRHPRAFVRTIVLDR
jgi:predicted ATP-grasp superfamily ATP-dependent carboligase